MALLHSTWFFYKRLCQNLPAETATPQPPPTHDPDVQEEFPPRLSGVRGLFWGWFHSASLKKDPESGVSPAVFPHRSGRISGVGFSVFVKTT